MTRSLVTITLLLVASAAHAEPRLIAVWEVGAPVNLPQSQLAIKVNDLYLNSDVFDTDQPYSKTWSVVDATASDMALAISDGLPDVVQLIFNRPTVLPANSWLVERTPTSDFKPRVPIWFGVAYVPPGELDYVGRALFSVYDLVPASATPELFSAWWLFVPLVFSRRR